MRRIGFAFASLALIACTASGSESEIHGPVYNDDASIPVEAGVDATNPNDATVPSDATTPDSAGNDAATNAESSTSDDAGTGADTSTPIDAGSDAPACTSPTVLLAGSASAVFGAVGTGRGALTAQTLTGILASAPAIAPFGGSFQALVQETTTNYLASSSSAPTSWSALATLTGNPAALAAPSVAAIGAELHAVYLGTNNKFYHATFNGTAWDNGSDPVGHVADGGTQAFGGPSPASAAGLATGELVIAYQGSNNLPYAQSWTRAGGWSDGVQIGTDTLAASEPPAIIALGGATHDLLVVYEKASNATLYSYVRTAASKAWSTLPLAVDATAFTTAAPSLTAMSGARALVGWEGTDGHPYVSVYTDTANAWSSPAPLVVGTSPAVTAAPSLATGNCGDDAVAAYVSSGVVSVTRLKAGAWSAPVSVTGASGVTLATVATSP